MSTFPRRMPRTDVEKQLTVEKRLTRGSLGGRSERIAPVTRRSQTPAPSVGGAAVAPIWAEQPDEPTDMPVHWLWFDTDDPGILPTGGSASAVIGTGFMYLVDDFVGGTPSTLAGGASLDLLEVLVDSGSDAVPTMTAVTGSPYWMIEVGSPGIYEMKLTITVEPTAGTDAWEVVTAASSFMGSERWFDEDGTFHWEFTETYRVVEGGTIGPVLLRNRSGSTGNLTSLNVTAYPLVLG